MQRFQYGKIDKSVLSLFNYHIIRYVYFRDFKQKIYNKIKIEK